MPTSQGAHEVKIANTIVAVPWPAMTVVAANDRTFVLLDPDAYLLDSEYKLQRRSGAPSFRNLWAFDDRGHKLWEAEFPEENDYYYKLPSITPLVALSFSSWGP